MYSYENTFEDVVFNVAMVDEEIVALRKTNAPLPFQTKVLYYDLAVFLQDNPEYYNNVVLSGNYNHDGKPALATIAMIGNADAPTINDKIHEHAQPYTVGTLFEDLYMRFVENPDSVVYARHQRADPLTAVSPIWGIWCKEETHYNEEFKRHYYFISCYDYPRPEFVPIVDTEYEDEVLV